MEIGIQHIFTERHLRESKRITSQHYKRLMALGPQNEDELVYYFVMEPKKVSKNSIISSLHYVKSLGNCYAGAERRTGFWEKQLQEVLHFLTFLPPSDRALVARH